MSQPVVIKSNKYGIQLMMDPEIPFAELLKAVAAKFQESRKFFRDAKLALAFEGRDLTQDESLRIIDAITANSDVGIICIIDEDKSKADMFRREIALYYDSIAGKEGDVYKGNIASGKVLVNDSGIIVVGDVEEGAKLFSAGYVIVMGTLNGEACVGDEGSFITALDMNPTALQIGGVRCEYEKKQEKEKKRRRREKPQETVRVEPFMAFVRGDGICIEKVEKGILE